MAKVSILMPACNVEAFIEECMTSVINQTLTDIEIICINDGSKDNTGKILDAFARADSRIHIVHKPNSGYGHSMNVALSLATGEYIGIIETDDFAELDMFENLYQLAVDHDADVVKSNYFRYKSKPEKSNDFFEVLGSYEKYDEVFSPRDFMDIMRGAPCIWSGLYKRSMLVDNEVTFNETPGASYQDTAFAFKVWSSAERVYLTREAYLHYRVDNENSSVKSGAKVFCLCDEYHAIEEYLDCYPEKKAYFEVLKNALKYESYRWNLQRLEFGFKYAFLLQMKAEFDQEQEKGLLDERYFSKHSWNNLQKILNDMNQYYQVECCKVLQPYKSAEELYDAYQDIQKQFDDMRNSISFKVGRKLTKLPRLLRDCIAQK